MQRKLKSTSDRRSAGVAHWLIRPASGWHHKTRSMTRNPLFLPLAIIGAAFIGTLLMNAWMILTQGREIPFLVLQSFFLWMGFLALCFVPVVIYHHLVAPLFHLRHWAHRVRGGNLAARIPVPSTGEFAELAQDVNVLTEQLQRLNREMEEAVHQQTNRLEEKSRTLEILYDVAASINTSRNLEDLLSRFLERIRLTLGARAATVRLLTPDNQMRLVANLGFHANGTHCRDLLPVGRCVCGKVIGNQTLLWKANVHECGHVSSEPGTPNPQTEPVSMPERSRAVRRRSENSTASHQTEPSADASVRSTEEPAMLAIPLQHQGKTLGVYSLFLDDWPESLSDDMENLLTSIGRHLGMAIEKARLDEEAQRLSIMEERTHLAHELHDSLAQTLATLRFKVGSLEEETRSANPNLKREIRMTREILQQANNELRELIGQFRAPIHRQDLFASIEKVIRQFRETNSARIFLQKDWKDIQLPLEIEIEILRILQESLCNIRKHANAKNVRVLMRAAPKGYFEVMIEDDGQGMDSPKTQGNRGEHIGLMVMEERAARIEGDLRIETEPGEGTRVILTFCYPKEQPIAFMERSRLAG